MICVINIFNRRCAHIGRAIGFGQFRAIGAAFYNATLTLDYLFHCKNRLNGGQITHETCNFLSAFQRLRGFGQSLAPPCFAQFTFFADVRHIKPLAAQAIPHKAGFIRNPFLVHAIMVARQDTHHFAPFCIHANIAAKRVHHIDSLGLAQLPRPRGKGIRLGGQRAHGAQVDDVALQVRIQCFPKIRGDLCILATACLAHLGDPCHLGGEAHAARAGNAARHVGFDQGAQVQIF